MARDFIIYNSDVKQKQILFTGYVPLISDYAIVVDGYSAIVPISGETVYEPISLQIPGPISLRQNSEPYILK